MTTTIVRTEIRKLPLKAQDGALLAISAVIEAAKSGLDVSVIQHALETAAFLHQDATRSVRKNLPKVPYIEHPLRNVIRMLRGYGVTDLPTIVSGFLHDVVEDEAKKIVTVLAGGHSITDRETRELAFDWIRSEFGPDVRDIVEGMSNPIRNRRAGETAAESHHHYLTHIVEASETDPRVAINKTADILDNAGSLRHQISDTTSRSDITKTVLRAQKYSPAIDYLAERTERDDVQALLSAEGRINMRQHLAETAVHVAMILTIHS